MRFASSALAVMILAALSLSTAPQAAASAQSRSCARRADQQDLQGAARHRFLAVCVKGSLAPRERTHPAPRSLAAKAITQPSGVDRTVRSQQCDDEAARRGLHDSGLQAFRKSCLASAAPVSATGGKQRPPTPTPANSRLDALTDAPRN